MAHKRAPKPASATEPTGGVAWFSAWTALLVVFVVLGGIQARVLLLGATGAGAHVLSSGVFLNAAIALLCLGQMLRPRFRRAWRYLLPPSLVLLAIAFYFLLERS